jgi:hypothetical protein
VRLVVRGGTSSELCGVGSGVTLIQSDILLCFGSVNIFLGSNVGGNLLVGLGVRLLSRNFSGHN